MLHILTIYASLLAIALTFKFCLGLVTLWNTTKPVLDPQPPVFDNAQKQPLVKGKATPDALKNEFDSSPWLEPLEVTTPQKQAANQVVKFQLCLPAAPVEVATLELELMALSIRRLKELAKERKLKNYSRFTKKELAIALS